MQVYSMDVLYVLWEYAVSYVDEITIKYTYLHTSYDICIRNQS